MKFKSIGAGGFGCLKEWQSPEINSNLVVFYGLNESGKTTLFNLLATLLYGWHPASKERNIYMPWNESVASCMGVLETDDAKILEITRTLRSKAGSTLIAEGASISLGNDALRQVAYLPRLIYDEVFAITIEQLRFPEKSVWDTLQDQLLGGQFSSFLRPVSAVAGELEGQANRLWRPDKMGKPESKQLTERILQLNKEKRAAQENEKTLHYLEAAIDAKTGEIAGLIEQKTRALMGIDRAERLLPVYKKVRRIGELIAMVGDGEIPRILGELPAEPDRVLAELERRIDRGQQEKQALLVQEEGLKLDRDAFSPQDEKVCSRAEQIKSLSKSYGLLKTDLRQNADLGAQMEACQGKILERARDLLHGGWREELTHPVDAVDEAELNAAVEGFRKAEAEFSRQGARVEGLKAKAEGGEKYRKLPLIAFFFLSLSLGGLLISHDSLIGFASMLAGFMSMILILAWWFFRKERALDIELAEAEKGLQKCKATLQQKRDAISTVLCNLPLVDSWLEWPGENLLVEISRLKSLLSSRAETARSKEKVDERIAETGAIVGELLQACEIAASAHSDSGGNASPAGQSMLSDGIGQLGAHWGDKHSASSAGQSMLSDGIGQLGAHLGDKHGTARSALLDSISLLETRLLDAEKAMSLHEAAKAKIVEVQDALCGLDADLAEAEVEKVDLQEKLGYIEGRDLNEKLQNLTNLRKWHSQAAALQEDLTREYPDLDAILEEIACYSDDGAGGLEGASTSFGVGGSDLGDARGHKGEGYFQGAGSGFNVDEGGIKCAGNSFGVGGSGLGDARGHKGEGYFQDALDGFRSVGNVLNAGEGGFFLGDEEKARLKAELGQIEEQLNQLNKDLGELRKDLQYGQEKPRLDDIEGEIRQAESDYQKAYRERDRLLLLRNVIVEADRRFRDEHQPEILTLAGKYLATITGGRYERLLLKDDNKPGLMVRSGSYGSPVDVALLSRGTLRQVYLSLRLALVDHLDSAGECLPLFLDEVLVHWDDERLPHGLDLLGQISGRRQVFLFTCHKWIAEKLENLDNVQTVYL